jgi:hypothetical protein
MQAATNKSTWLFLATFILTFYGVGASFVESFVNYPTWPLVGANEFRAFHLALGQLLIPIMVIPMLIATLLTMLLLWLRPAPIPRWVLWLSVALQLVTWAATAAIQLPIQFELSRDGLSPALIDRLIFTNWWLRRVPNLLNAGLFIWMMSLLLRTADQRRTEARVAA